MIATEAEVEINMPIVKIVRVNNKVKEEAEEEEHLVEEEAEAIITMG